MMNSDDSDDISNLSSIIEKCVFDSQGIKLVALVPDIIKIANKQKLSVSTDMIYEAIEQNEKIGEFEYTIPSGFDGSEIVNRVKTFLYPIYKVNPYEC